jgi:hypothetical protein
MLFKMLFYPRFQQYNLTVQNRKLGNLGLAKFSYVSIVIADFDLVVSYTG